MARISDSEPSESLFKKINYRVIALILVITGMGFLAWGIYGHYTRGLPPKSVSPEQAMAMMEEGRPPSPEARRAMMEQTMNQVGFSEEQKEKMRKVWESDMPGTREEWQARRAAMEKIATPEQIQKFQQVRRQGMQRMMERARQTMSPQDFATLQRRMAERMARGGGRRGGFWNRQGVGTGAGPGTGSGGGQPGSSAGAQPASGQPTGGPN